MILRITIAVSLVLGLSIFATPPQPVEAAGCVKFVASKFNAPGNDNLRRNLNGEWVRIKNTCNRPISLKAWRIHDKSRKNIFVFGADSVIGPGRTVTVFSGVGPETPARKFFGKRRGEVWGVYDKAFLKRPPGVTVSTRLEKKYVKPKPKPAPAPTPTPKTRTCDWSYPTLCLRPNAPDLDCGDISKRDFPVRGKDPHGFDGDNDGIGCES